MDAYIANVPLQLLIAMQVIKQWNIENCDLYYVPTSNNAEELVESVRKTGVFKSVTMLPNISIEYPITASQCVNIARRRFTVRKLLKNRHYDTVYYNTDGWLLNSIVYSSLPNRKSTNIFVENGINPYITPYDSKEWYLRLFINCNFMTCMDGRFIDKRYIFEPDLISVPQSGKIERIDKLDRNDSLLKSRINSIFGYDHAKDSFQGKRIIIMEQGPRREKIDMLGLWSKVSPFISKEATIVKAHPRQKESALRKLGYDMYERYTIPWEVLSFNEDMNDKILLTIFSTSCVYPKIMYDDEPTVILLYKLLGMDYSFFGKGMIQFVESVRNLYRDKDRFFIPESWEQLGEYLKAHS